MYKLKNGQGNAFLCNRCNKKVLDNDLELYDFYVTTYSYFKANVFKNWIKAGCELDKNNETKLSNITYCRSVIFHHLKTGEDWEDTEYLVY